MLGCRGLLLQQHQQQQQLQLQRRRFEKLCRRRPQADRALCRWALGRGARLHTPHLRLHGSGGHLYARKAIEVGGSKKRLLFTVPMTTSIGLPGPSSPDGDGEGPGRSSEWAASSGPDSSSAATTSGTAHARALEEWLALSRATLTASLVDNDPRHVFAKAFVDRAFARASASSDISEDDFVDEEADDDDDDGEAQEEMGIGSIGRLHHHSKSVGTSVAGCAVYTTTLSDARYPAACVFADRMQRAVASAMLSAVQGVAPLVRPTMAAVLQAAVVNPPLPFEIVPFVDRIDPAAPTATSDANVELSCFVDADFEPHFKVTATMDIAARERLRVDLQCPAEGRRGDAAVTTAASWAGMSAAEQDWVRFGRRPPEPPLRPGTRA